MSSPCIVHLMLSSLTETVLGLRLVCSAVGASVVAAGCRCGVGGHFAAAAFARVRIILSYPSLTCTYIL